MGGIGREKAQKAQNWEGSSRKGAESAKSEWGICDLRYAIYALWFQAGVNDNSTVVFLI